ncbi:MMPL family transporter [Streptomyces sp. GS7]|uniref:MMPL family transporter n=1 Tax=Streptomyces sp. GS7 TaxID=2692234 RepID=UPI001318C8A4|nr:MMPL family transporter [Streptomyces sp. GS7]QHC22904.1 MMPL family transporter [Streptomyces sp. GS7]
MLRRLGHFLSRHARAVLAVAGILTLAAGAAGFGAFGELKAGGFDDPNAPSATVTRRLEARFGGTDNLVLLVRPRRGTVDTLAAKAAGRALTEQVARAEGVSGLTSYWRTPAPALRSRDGRAALILVRLAGDPQQVSTRADQLIAEHAQGGADDRELTVLAGGPAGTNHDVTGRVAEDLRAAEAIAVPVTAVLLILVFRGLVSALIPLAIGVVAILGTLAELALIARLTDVSVFAINLTTALGLGLAIDYGLLMVSRFRELSLRHGELREAVALTVATAGRTILFSAATVAAALTTLLIFPLYFLRSFAYAGIGVIAVAATSAVLLTPALLTVAGSRIARTKTTRDDPRRAEAGSRLWGRIGEAAVRRPLRFALPAVVLLLVAATPLLRAGFGTPDEQVLPKSSGTRQVATALRHDFPSGTGNPVEVVVEGSAPVAPYARDLAALPSVAAVETGTGTFTAGAPNAVPPADPRLAVPGLQHLIVRTGLDPSSGRAQRLVERIRALSPPDGSTVLVGGTTAQLVDTKAAIEARLPFAVTMIAVTTFVLLFLFTGSVVQPLRALALNALGLGAILGAMVWIFQEGHLSSLLGFTDRPMDTAMTLLMFCIVFGLSMDYEVFVISRIKELRDQGLATGQAVPQGLARSGGIISAAAALLAVSLLAFTTSSVSFMQMFGLGSGLAVLLDATLIRGALTPACLALLGDHGWYAPGWLRRAHQRIGLSDATTSATAATAPSAGS